MARRGARAHLEPKVLHQLQAAAVVLIALQRLLAAARLLGPLGGRLAAGDVVHLQGRGVAVVAGQNFGRVAWVAYLGCVCCGWIMFVYACLVLVWEGGRGGVSGEGVGGDIAGGGDVTGATATTQA